jgi:poly-gamma-glutamate synthesis protein (capsule biosynthesis protein)
VPICYDLGDYVDDYAVDPALRNDRSFLFTFEVERGGVRRITLAPVLIDGWQGRVDLAEGADAAETMATMAARCRELGTAVARTGQALTVAVPAAAA